MSLTLPIPPELGSWWHSGQPRLRKVSGPKVIELLCSPKQLL